MTKFIVFDTETTGLSKMDEVIQFAGFVLDVTFNPTSVVNFYSDTQVPITPGAFNVHRLTKAKLHELGKGVFFEDNWESFTDTIRQHQVVWIDWCRGSFDCRMINQTLENNGLPEYFHFPVSTDLKECLKNKFSVFDLMGALCHKLGKSSLNLAQAVSMLPYTKSQINYVYDDITRNAPNVDRELRYHNALYDAFTTTLLLKYYFS